MKVEAIHLWATLDFAASFAPSLASISPPLSEDLPWKR